MLRLIGRFLAIAGRYSARIKVAFVFSFFKSMFAKAPVILAFFGLVRF